MILNKSSVLKSLWESREKTQWKTTARLSIYSDFSQKCNFKLHIENMMIFFPLLIVQTDSWSWAQWDDEDDEDDDGYEGYEDAKGDDDDDDDDGDEGVTWKDPRPSSNTSRSRLLTFSGEKAKTV